MKKLLLFIAFALAAIFAQAQDYTRDSLFLEVRCPTDTPYFSLKQPSSTSTSDGKILTRITSKTLLGGHLVDFGDWLYRIDPQNLVVVDSVFVETNYGFEEYNGSVLLADAPDDEGFEGIEGESLILLLDDKGISASSGSACTSGSLEPSHVLLAIGRPHEVAHGSLRLSISEEIKEEEIDYIINSVKEVVEYLRNMSPFWRDLVNGKRKHVFMH